MNRTCILFTLLLCSLFTHAQVAERDLIYKHIDFLADDRLMGRGTGTEYEVKAARYIARHFRRNGLEPMGNEGYFYHFQYRLPKNPHDTSTAGAPLNDGMNVVAFLDNGAPHTVVIGAHFDHLGLGHDHNSREANPEGKIHNGADDNASGVAGLLELAAWFSGNGVREKNNFLFMAFSGEELGLIGSKKWCDQPTVPLTTINYMINMDMIGRLNDSTKKLLVYGVGTSSEWIPALEKTNHYFSLKYDSSGVGPSDQTSFYLKEIPVLHFFTGQHQDYHKPSDDIEWINIDGEAQVLNLIASVVEELDDKGKLPFYKTRNTDTSRRSFKVTMGVMPDYTYEHEGMRLDGITEGKPAAKAGLQAGDVIIQMGDLPVKSVQDYMKVLSTHQKGDKVNVILLRKGVRIEKQVEL